MADIPGVWDYIYKNPHDYGANFSAGINAGANARKVKDDREQEAARLAQQSLRDEENRKFNEGRLKLDRDKLDADKAEAERRFNEIETRRKDDLIIKFGPSVIRTPDGQIDVEGSAREHDRRMEEDRKAEMLGRQEIITGKQAGPEFDALKKYPGYLRGQTDEASKNRTIQAQKERDKARNDTTLEAARIRSQKKAEKGADTIENVNGADFIRHADGSLSPLPKDTANAMKKARGATNAVPAIRVGRGPDGSLQIQR